jgi:hypothetical protein
MRSLVVAMLLLLMAFFGLPSLADTIPFILSAADIVALMAVLVLPLALLFCMGLFYVAAVI